MALPGLMVRPPAEGSGASVHSTRNLPILHIAATLTDGTFVKLKWGAAASGAAKHAAAGPTWPG
jgi:hypothetical protein